MEDTNTLKLQQVQCPSCKRPINTFNPDHLMAECPYCHSKLVNPLVKPKEVPTPERIITFTTAEGDFEQSMINALVNQDYVPLDIFDSISTGKVVQTYLPMFLFEGTYNASWSCETAYEDEVSTIKEGYDGSIKAGTKKVKKWLPQNGNTAGNFAFLCLANEGNEIPDELRQFTRLFPYDVMLSKEFKTDMIDYNDENLMTLERNSDATIIWQKHGKEMVEATALNAAKEQLTNREIRNFRSTTSHQLTTTGKYLLVPFWFVYYQYKGNQYYYLMDGVGQRNQYSYPVNQEEVALVEKKNKVKKIVKWLWPLAIALLFIKGVGFVGALIYLAVWFIAKIVVGKVMDNQINKQLTASREARQAAAAKLG